MDVGTQGSDGGKAVERIGQGDSFKVDPDKKPKVIDWR